jgi:2-phosphosulfolactate phosphatase
MNRVSIHIDWGTDGLRYAIKQKHIVVIVDALRFSSAVVTAVANGFTVYPTRDPDKGVVMGPYLGADVAGHSPGSRYSLSPRTYLNVPHEANKKVVMVSPNGAACAEIVDTGDTAYIGCFLNARALGAHMSQEAVRCGQNVTVIAAGEQRAIDTGERIVYDRKAAQQVFAVEDYLAAGACISFSSLARTPEAEVCAIAFTAACTKMDILLRESFSGRYLVEHGLGDDITHAAQLNKYTVIPCVTNGEISAV